MKPSQLKDARNVIQAFNVQQTECIKHLVGTAGFDPYDVEEGDKTSEDMKNEMHAAGYRIITSRDPEKPNESIFLLYKDQELIAGIVLTLDIKTTEIKRGSLLVEDETVKELGRELYEEFLKIN